LAPGDLRDVVPELLLGDPGIPATALGLNNRQHGAIGVVEAVVGDAIPRFGVVAIDRDLATQLRAITEFPPGFFDERIDQERPSLGFTQFELRLGSGGHGARGRAVCSFRKPSGQLLF